MTAFETYILDFAQKILRSDEDAGREQPTTLEQRLAIGLTQARAAECRHLAGEIDMKILEATDPRLRHVFAFYAAHLRERSHKMEALAMEMAKTWPPPEGGGERVIVMGEGKQ